MNSLIFKAGDKISVPLGSKLNLDTDVYLERKSCVNQSPNNLRQKLHLNGYRLEINNLQEGVYILSVFSLGLEVEIRILSNKNKWETENQVYNKETETIYEIKRNLNNMISIGDATLSPKEGTFQVQIGLDIPESLKNDNLRAHCFATNFISPQLSFRNSNPQLLERNNFQTQTFKVPQSSYYNNKKLSDEGSYVINRQNEPKFIGNNLEKPRILLKRIQVRETAVTDEVLNQQQQFSKERRRDMSRDRLECFLFDAQKRSAKGGARQQLENVLTSHNNFLKTPCISINNLNGNVLKFTIPNTYQSFKILLITRNCILEKYFNINGLNSTFKDMRHSGLKQEDQSLGWAMSRQCYTVQKGQSIKVNRNSQWCTVSVSNICNFAKIRGVPLDEWIINWNTYEQSRKLTIYDKECCHELNVYIYQNDKAFFDKVVKPFIRNKMVKTFVDLYLLNDESCQNFYKLSEFNKLNEFEKVLLIQWLVSRGQKQKARQIADRMVLTEKSKRIPFSEFNYQFDTVINAKEEPKKVQQQPKMQSMKMAMRMAPRSKMVEQSCLMSCDERSYQRQVLESYEYVQRKDYQKGFQQVQKTKQYTEVTYSGIKDPSQSSSLVQPSLFWATLANHLASASQSQFVSDSFLYLRTKIDFTLALCFLPNTPNSQFELTNDGDRFNIWAKSSFLVFVKQVRPHKYEKKFGVMINQRFFDPTDRSSYQQDGTKLDKQVEQFVIRKPYCVQTIVTNTSGTNLEMQMLLDIPEGAISLQSNEYTQIVNCEINAYSTQSFQRSFYFPSQGTYSFYAANACRNKLIIAKSAHSRIQVKKFKTILAMNTLSDVMRSGTQENVIDYLRSKNIFDNTSFNPSFILWMLKDKSFFEKVVTVLRDRFYYDADIWSYGLYHNSRDIALEYVQDNQSYLLKYFNLPILQYFPYYSPRCHKFQDQTKSNIRNVQFKETFYAFMIVSIIGNQRQTTFKLTFAYYLLLQDRIDDALKCCSELTEKQRAEHQIQLDYIECFADICQGYPNFVKARKISSLYTNYPILSWKKVFNEVQTILKEFDTDSFVEEKVKTQYETTVIRDVQELRINIPADTEVRVHFYSINIELYFSSFPFASFDFKEPMKATHVIRFESGNPREQKVKRPENMKDSFTVVEQLKEGSIPKKISSFHWVNPEIKVQITQQQGTAKVYYKGKKLPGCYCKVFSNGVKGEKFYRDGYTDITGTFKYVLADLSEITEFSILFMTEHGGVVMKAGLPNTSGTLVR